MQRAGTNSGWYAYMSVAGYAGRGSGGEVRVWWAWKRTQCETR